MSENLDMNDFDIDDEGFNLSDVDDSPEQHLANININGTATEGWTNLSWKQKWEEAFANLANGHVQWDSSNGSHSVVLEEFKRQALIQKNPQQVARPTLLHELAQDFGAGNFQAIPESTRLQVVKFLLEHHVGYHQTTAVHETREDPILEVAMRHDNLEFLKYIAKHCTERLPGLLDVCNQSGMNPLHYAFKHHIPETLTNTKRAKRHQEPMKTITLAEFLELLKGFVSQAKPETVVAQDKFEKNTPIHYALSYKLCLLKPSWYSRSIIQPLVMKGDIIFKKDHGLQFNGHGESPYLYHKNSEENHKQHASKRDVGNRKLQELVPAIPSSASKLEGDEREAGEEMEEVTESSVDLNQDHELLQRGKQLQSQGETPDWFYDTPKVHKTIANPNEGPPASSISGRAPGGLISSGRKDTFHGIMSTALQPRNEILLHKATKAHKMKPESLENAYNKSSPETANDIGDHLKLHYIRTRADMEAKELLYGRVASGKLSSFGRQQRTIFYMMAKQQFTTDKNLYFDATHQQGKTAEEVVDLVDLLSRAGGFEDTLSYVALPELQHPEGTSVSLPGISRRYFSNEARLRGANEKNKMSSNKVGRASLVRVFDKLSERGVRAILRLRVQDLDSQAHKDAAIERAIRGRDAFSFENHRASAIHIESWDWRKLDLSIDVILFAAPSVSHIHLYWSGNWSVLNGWAGPNGISRLYLESNKKLRTVTIYAFQGLETIERAKKLVDRFRSEVKVQTNNEVKLEIHWRSSDHLSGSRSEDDLGNPTGGRSNGPPHHAWISCMEEFRSALSAVHKIIRTKNLCPRRIKVAVIDDGLDLSSLDTYNDIVQATGLSYCPPTGSTELPWHQSTQGHGTIMANMIVRINPWVSLDVMRIEDSSSHKQGAKGGTRDISALSAAKAIEGARIRKADIISMSWSIRKLAKTKVATTAASVPPTREEQAIAALQEAIDSARKDNILMFCSAADDIQRVGKDSLPFSGAADYIFRIGAALSHAQRDAATEDANSISYFFPGNQVADAWNPRSAKTVEYHDGSSVATALAAGFASLIMYITNVVREYHASMAKGDSQSRRQVEKRDSWVNRLRYHGSMRRAFDNINRREPDDKKFLPVWHVFGEATRKMRDAKGEKVLDELDDLVSLICNNLEAD